MALRIYNEKGELVTTDSKLEALLKKVEDRIRTVAIGSSTQSIEQHEELLAAIKEITN